MELMVAVPGMYNSGKSNLPYGWLMNKGFLVLLLAATLASPAFAQQPQQADPRAQAYYHFAKARILDGQGQWNAAVDEYKKALELDSNNSLIYSEMADTYFRNGRVQNAADAAEQAVKIDPNNISAHRILSSIYTSAIGTAAGQQRVPLEAIDRAIHEFEEILRIDQTDQQSYLMLGRLYQVKDEPKKAEEIYRQFLGANPGSEEGVLALSKLQIDNGNYDEAVNLLEKYLQTNDDSGDAWETIGQAYLSLEKFDKASVAFKKALEDDPDNPDLKRALAQALFFGDKPEEAAKIYLDMLNADPNDGMALLRLGEIYREEKHYGQAHVYMQKAVQLFPDNVEVQYNMMLLERAEGLVEEALHRDTDLLKKTERANGKYSESEQQYRRQLLAQEGDLDSTLGHYDDAIKAFTDLKAVSDSKDGQVDAWIVNTYRAAKNTDKALSYCEQALKENPDSRALQIEHADLIAEKGRVDEGVQALQKLIKNTDDDLLVLSTEASVYERAKKYDQAQSILETAFKRFPKDQQVYFMQGGLYEKQKKYADAEAAFRKSLDIEKDNPDTLNYLGYMLADQGMKLQEALELIQKAVDLDPNNGAYLDSLGWAYFRLNKLDQAEEYLKKAIRFDSNDSTVHDHMGDLYLKLQKYEDARSEWNKSVQLSDDPEEIARVKKKIDSIKTKLAQK